MRRTTVALLLASTLACGKDGLGREAGAPEIGREAAVLELCIAYVMYATLFDRSFFPNGPYCLQRPLVGAQDYPAEVLEVVCRPGIPAYEWAEALYAAGEAGRVVVDYAGARRCTEAARAVKSTLPAHELTDSPDWLAVTDGVCRDFYHGTVPDGGACVDDWDCAEGASGCYTDTPFVAGSLRCAPTALEGQPCSAWHACVQGQYCFAGVCEPLDPGVPRGEACASDFDCAGDCVDCRATEPGGPTTCQKRGGLGDTCATSFDCVGDLACMDGLCGWFLAGENCRLNGLCEYPLVCASACWEHDNREADCVATGQCEFFQDPDYGYCEPVQNGLLDYACVAPPEAGGPCVFGTCPYGTHCRRPEALCEPLALAGEACDPVGNGLPPCYEFLLCEPDGCRMPCLVAEDCAPGEVCDASGASPTCRAIEAGRCATDAECASGEYCADCGYVLTEQSCRNTVGCAWQESGYCYDSCYALDGDAVACEAEPGCVVSGTLCNRVCSSLGSDQAACEAETGCRYDPAAFSRCEPACAALTDLTACDAAAGCGWNATSAACEPDCSAHADSTACGADAGCRWVGACVSTCGDSFTSTSCTAEPAACEWRPYGACEPAGSCFGLAENTCDVSPGCTFIVTAGVCEAAGPAATFACQGRLEVGEPCTGDEMCVSSTCADDAGTLRCAEPAWDDRWFNSAWFLRLAVALTGVLVLRRRIRS